MNTFLALIFLVLILVAIIGGAYLFFKYLRKLY